MCTCVNSYVVIIIIIIIKGIYIAQVRKGHECAKGHKCYDV